MFFFQVNHHDRKNVHHTVASELNLQGTTPGQIRDRSGPLRQNPCSPHTNRRVLKTLNGCDDPKAIATYRDYHARLFFPPVHTLNRDFACLGGLFTVYRVVVSFLIFSSQSALQCISFFLNSYSFFNQEPWLTHRTEEF